LELCVSFYEERVAQGMHDLDAVTRYSESGQRRWLDKRRKVSDDAAVLDSIDITNT